MDEYRLVPTIGMTPEQIHQEIERRRSDGWQPLWIMANSFTLVRAKSSWLYRFKKWIKTAIAL